MPSSSLLAALAAYRIIVSDVWGVIHDGQGKAFDTVKPFLNNAQKAGIPVIFFSNSPRRKDEVIATLASLGIERNMYHDVISSGEIYYDYMTKLAEERDSKLSKQRYYIIAHSTPGEVLPPKYYEKVDNPNDADFIVFFGPPDQKVHVTTWDIFLKMVVASKKPVHCINPDISAGKGGSLVCAGALAERYKQLGGGEVWYCGKPYSLMYEYTFKILQQKMPDLKKSDILFIGDTLKTDIEGAHNFGSDSLLVGTGINNKQAAAGYHILPTYFAEDLNLNSIVLKGSDLKKGNSQKAGEQKNKALK